MKGYSRPSCLRVPLSKIDPLEVAPFLPLSFGLFGVRNSKVLRRMVEEKATEETNKKNPDIERFGGGNKQTKKTVYSEF